MPKPEPGKLYNFFDFYSWDDEERWELIAGVPIHLPKSWPIRHQSALFGFSKELDFALKEKPCQLIMGPIAVRLNPDGKDDMVVQPDFVIVCDKTKLADGIACKGVPDLIGEVLSSPMERHDLLTKFKVYKEAGVREYWIVSPKLRIATACALSDGK
ncbi:MAG: Uma2 family endonuclease [Clostridiales bacterium]|jgi:Uma2 family endonuclease|nr:Uma2 family endonuclease [Clostridiales bacterium]